MSMAYSSSSTITSSFSKGRFPKIFSRLSLKITSFSNRTSANSVSLSLFSSKSFKHVGIVLQ